MPCPTWPNASVGEQFYRDHIAKPPSFPSEPGDYETAAQMAGKARLQGKGKPSVVDALLAAIAIRTGATVATRNVTDFAAMSGPCQDPQEESSAKA